MEFRVLGPLEVRDNGRVLELGGAKQRAVLALLLLHANEVVSLDRLIDAIWGEQPPDTAAAAVHGSISRLRKVLEPNGAPYGVLRTQPPGYLVAADPESLDRHRFERLAADGKAALEQGDPGRAGDVLREALALWRGSALADLAHTIADCTEIERLEEERLAALEGRIDADLALGRHAELVPELEALVARHPLRERLRGQLMLALYQCGRQADALAAYREGSRLLDEELGLAPGPELRELERRILLQDPDLVAPRPSPLLARLPGRTRRTRLVIAVGAALSLVALVAAVAIPSLRGGNEMTVARVVPNGLGAIDPESNKLVQSIRVGSYPAHVAVGDGSVWVANAGDHTVSRIDAESGRVTTTKGLTGAPVSLNVSRGTVWIAMSHFDQPTSIMRLDGTPNESASHVVELTPGPGLLFPVIADGPSGLWTSLEAWPPRPDTFVLPPSGDVQRLDLFPPDCLPVGSGIADGTVWIGCQDGRLVRVEEETRRRVATTRVGSLLSALAVGAGSVWAADIGENVVWRIDVDTGRPSRTIPVGRKPSAIAVGLGAIWVANRGSGTVSRIDPETNRVVATIPAAPGVNAVAVGNGMVWVTVPGEVTETH